MPKKRIDTNRDYLTTTKVPNPTGFDGQTIANWTKAGTLPACVVNDHRYLPGV